MAAYVGTLPDSNNNNNNKLWFFVVVVSDPVINASLTNCDRPRVSILLFSRYFVCGLSDHIPSVAVGLSVFYCKENWLKMVSNSLHVASRLGETSCSSCVILSLIKSIRSVDLVNHFTGGNSWRVNYRSGKLTPHVSYSVSDYPHHRRGGEVAAPSRMLVDFRRRIVPQT